MFCELLLVDISEKILYQILIYIFILFEQCCEVFEVLKLICRVYIKYTIKSNLVHL